MLTFIWKQKVSEYLKKLDYSLLESSEFRAHRAQEIFDRYFVGLSPDTFPSELLEREELVQNLLSEMPSENIFDYFKGQVYILLNESVYPQYIKYRQSLGVDRIKKSLNYEDRKRIFKKIVLDRDPSTCSEEKEKLKEIFEYSSYLSYFKLYLVRNGVSELLYFYIEASEFSQMFSDLQKQIIDQKKTDLLNDDYLKGKEFFYTSCTKIYDKFLRQGASMQVKL